MLLDMQNTLSDQQALTGTGNVLSTNTIDLWNGNTAPAVDPYGGRAISDVGRGQPVQMLVQVTEKVAGATSVQAQVVMADNAALSAALTVVTETAAVPVAQLVPGYQFRIGALPPGISQRFLGIRYVIAGTATGGKVTAGVVYDRGAAGRI